MSDNIRIGVGQPPMSGSDYPFIGDSSDASITILDIQLQTRSDLGLPIRLRTANNVGGPDTSLEPDLVLEDAMGNQVFRTGSSTYLGKTTWANGYAVHRWVSLQSQLVLVLDTNSYGDSSATLSPNAILDPRTYNVLKNDVRQISVYNQGDTAPIVSVDDTSLLAIKPGYNFRIDSNEPARTGGGSRVGTQLKLNAIGGEGLGWADDCGNSDPLVRTVNLTSAEAGSLLLSDGDCMRVQPKLNWDSESVPSIEPGTILLADDCLPCCDCDDYLRVNRAISRIDRDNVDTANALFDTRDKLIALAEMVQADDNYSTSYIRSVGERNGDCGVNILGAITNPTEEPWDDVTLVFKFFDTTNGAETPRYPDDVPPRASRLSRLVDVGNTPIIQSGGNELMINVGCVYPGETKSASFGFNLLYSGSWKFCVHELDKPDPASCSCGFVSCQLDSFV